MQEFCWPLRVYYEDTDSGGVVYYANYLRFMERARTEWLRALGFEQDALARDGALFMVRSAQLDYRRPARFNDRLLVRSTLDRVRRASLRFSQAVCLAAYPEQPLCSGLITVACVNTRTMKPRALPASLLTELAVDR